jgi:hypothetical protein
MKHVIVTTLILSISMTFSSCSPMAAPITTLSPSSTYTPIPTATYIPIPTATFESTKTPEMAIRVIWPTTTEQGNQIIQKILGALSDAGIQIVDAVSFTDASDPNSLLGRPHQYIAKAVWRDPTIAAQGEASIDNGGTIEVFLTPADLQARYDYIDAITSSSPMFAEYHYQNAPAFVRLSKAYLPSQAQKIADIFLALVFDQ